MDHWQQLAPQRILRFDHRELVADQRRATARLLDFCGLPWDERCMHYYDATGRVQTASNHQVRQPIMKNSISQWQSCKRYLKPAADILGIPLVGVS